MEWKWNKTNVRGISFEERDSERAREVNVRKHTNTENVSVYYHTWQRIDGNCFIRWFHLWGSWQVYHVLNDFVWNSLPWMLQTVDVVFLVSHSKFLSRHVLHRKRHYTYIAFFKNTIFPVIYYLLVAFCSLPGHILSAAPIFYYWVKRLLHPSDRKEKSQAFNPMNR